MALTEQDLDLVDARIAERKAREYMDQHRLPEVIGPAPGTWEHDLMLVQERKFQERRAAHEAEQERERLAREEQERERAEEYERRRPEREKAQRELAKLSPELAAAERRLEELRRRERELTEASR